MLLNKIQIIVKSNPVVCQFSDYFLDLKEGCLIVYKEQRSIQDIMKAYSIPSTTTVYKVKLYIFGKLL